MILKNRIAVTVIAIFVIGMISGTTLAAEKPKDYPERPIEFVVGYGPGGGSDVFTRTVCIPARKKIRNVPLVVVNKPGAGGGTAVNYVQGQPADGYTIFAGSTVITCTGNLGGTVKYTYTDWRQVMRAQYDTTTIAVKGEGGKYNNIQDLIADAKARPGEVTVGAVGRVNFWNVVIGQFADPLGLKFKVVPFNSAGKVYAAVMGGHIDATLEEPATMIELQKAKKMKIILTFTEERLKMFPDIPCTKELGAEAYISVYRGLAVKKGTPEPIVQYLHDVFKWAYDSDYYQSYQKFEYMDLRPGYLGPDDMDKFVIDQYKLQYCEYKKRGYLSGDEIIKPDCK